MIFLSFWSLGVLELFFAILLALFIYYLVKLIKRFFLKK